MDLIKEMKTNKYDSDMQMKCVDIMHKQVTHMAVLLIEIIKQGIIQKTENETSKQQRQKFLL